ncbi:hypothetical protein [Synechococcus sp. MIT S9504]|uniref:hypothetical protein n=1 Tax=Synechococcus sp. MIT S9504 TaxID=1801628 RepID=UPI0012E7454E|nr:hypothetical protein [Synechococcus sp. MIT S9504]
MLLASSKSKLKLSVTLQTSSACKRPSRLDFKPLLNSNPPSVASLLFAANQVLEHSLHSMAPQDPANPQRHG